MKKETRVIRNKHINDYLYEHSYFPYYEWDDECYYKSTKRFKELLDNYYIQYIIIPNKL